MADLSTLARPYAKAAFDYANENGVVGLSGKTYLLPAALSMTCRSVLAGQSSCFC